MYNYFQDKTSLIKTAIYFSIGCLLTMIFPIINACTGSSYNPAILSDALGLLYILVGWAYGNHISNQWRRDKGQYDGNLPLETRVKIMKFRYPLILGGLLSIFVGELVNMIFVFF